MHDKQKMNISLCSITKKRKQYYHISIRAQLFRNRTMDCHKAKKRIYLLL